MHARLQLLLLFMQVMRVTDGLVVNGAAGGLLLSLFVHCARTETLGCVFLAPSHGLPSAAAVTDVSSPMLHFKHSPVADAEGKTPGSARKAKPAGGSGYDMSPELRKVLEAMRAAVAPLPHPPADDKKQGLPQVVKDLLPGLSRHLTRCADLPYVSTPSLAVITERQPCLGRRLSTFH